MKRRLLGFAFLQFAGLLTWSQEFEECDHDDKMHPQPEALNPAQPQPFHTLLRG